MRSCLLLLFSAGPILAQPVLGGRVLGPDGEPVAGARLELAPVPSNYEAGRLRLEGAGAPPAVAAAESDGEGRFLLRAPHPGVWQVVARAAGMVPMQLGPVLLLESEELPPVRLLPNVGIRVQILDPEGAVPRAWVVASTDEESDAGRRGTSGWQPEFRVGRTADDGSLTLPRFADERLRVSVHAPGRAEEIQGVEKGIVRLTADAGEALTLRVVTPGGEAVPEVLVRAGSTLWPVGWTGSEGELTVPVGGEPSRFVLIAPDGRQQVFRAGAHRGHAEERVVLAPAVRVRGKVLDARGRKGVAGASVWRTTDPGSVVHTDGDGGYTLTVSASQRLTLVVKAAGYLPRRLALSPAELAEGRGPTVALERAVALAGSVVGPDGEPLPGTTVQAVHVSNLGARGFSELDPVSDRATTDHDGRFELRRLRANQAYELRADRRGYFPAAIEAVAPDAGSRREAVQIHLRALCGVHGRVEDPEARPLGGTRITLAPARRVEPTGDRPKGTAADLADVVAVESDAAGRFAVAEPPADEVDLEASRQGFAPALRRALSISTPCRGSFDLGTLVLRPGARLAGRVVDRKGRPLAGAEVFVVDQLPPRTRWLEALRDRSPEISTDGRGGFTLEDLPPGVAQHLLVRAPGHLVAAVRGARPPLAEPLLIRMEPAALLRGRVVDTSDAGVSGARVSLEWQRFLPGDPRKRAIGEPILRSTLSDEEGRFEIGDVPEGDVSLHVTARGFVPVEGRSVRLPPRGERELVLVLREGASLGGRISTTTGEAVSDVRVSIGGHTAASDAEGFYALDGIAPGNQELQVFHPHYPPLLRDVRIDEGANALDLELESGFEVSGRVLDEGGEPVTTAEVVLTPENRAGLRIHQARTGEDGRFRLKPVRSGRYRLEARAAGLAPGELSTLVVSGQPIEGLEVVLRPGATVSGWVLGLTPEELAVVEVTAHLAIDQSRAGRVDAEGGYEIRDLSPGDWLLRARVWDGQREVEARVPIAPSDRSLEQDLEFGRRLTLSGRVLLGDEPLPASHVAVRGERFGTERSVVTGFDGRFLFEDLEPDVYWLGVKDSNRLLVHNQALELPHDLDVDVRLETASIAGSVLAASGAPIAGGLLSLRPTEGPDFLFTDSTLADGTFRLLNLPPGTYRVTVTASDHEPAERVISVAAGEELEGVEFVLPGAQGIELRALLASGTPPPMVHVLARSDAGAPVLAGSFTVGPAGGTKLSMLPAGDWQLTVGATGGATVTHRVTVPGEPIAITLPPAAGLHVQIPELARENLLATVRLEGPGQEPFWKLGPGGHVEQSWILRGGKATVDAVPAGEWSVVAEASDGRSWAGLVVVAGTADSWISLE